MPPEDPKKAKPPGTEEVRVVIFFDDIKIDLMAEQLGVETKMKNFDCTKPFKVYARDLFL